MPAQQPADPSGEPSVYAPRATGDGAGGTYVFTDLAHLDRVLGKLTTLSDGIDKDGGALERAASIVKPPADDDPSVTQADATRTSLTAAWEHNQRMRAYAESYIERLQATRAEYTRTEQTNTDRFPTPGEA